MKPQVVRSVAGWRSVRTSDGFQDKSVGFVPTMGALHEGHAALIERARAGNDFVVLSIFVNPTQFNDPKDFERYPITWDADLAMAGEKRVDYVIAPDSREIYADAYRFRVSESTFSNVMEGAFRPGHFDGVLTVVLKLLLLVRPDRAYFGEKDRQQLMLVKDMAAAFLLPTEIVPCPTVRTPEGLALSSRNRLLSPEGRVKAAEFARILRTHKDVGEARQRLADAGFSVDYVENHDQWRFGAVRLEGIRLIDNVPIEDSL
ncbi:MAG TPA: pantoate--beta-alanine ligase [Opitutaceae bacterium]